VKRCREKDREGGVRSQEVGERPLTRCDEWRMKWQ
jgi:hypothetical protein